MNYIANPVIAWDYTSKYHHYPNGATHMVELGYNVSCIVCIDETLKRNYVFVFKIDLNTDKFCLQLPDTIEENNNQYLLDRYCHILLEEYDILLHRRLGYKNYWGK